MGIKAVLFDKDGTLIDFGDTFFQASIEVIRLLADGNAKLALQLADGVGLDLNTGHCRADSEMVGGTARTIAEIWQPMLGRGNVEELAVSLDRYFDNYTQEAVSIFNYTRSTLTVLDKQNIIMGVATNDSEINARNHLAAIEIDHFFPFVAGYDSGFGSKPEPGMVNAFSSKHEFEPHEIIMVGDSINDLLAGRNAGAIAVAVTSGLAEARELEPFADHVLNDISLLPQLLTQI